MDKHIIETLLCDLTEEQIYSYTAKQLIAAYIGILIFSTATSYRVKCETPNSSILESIKEIDEEIEDVIGEILLGIKQICEFKGENFNEIL